MVQDKTLPHLPHSTFEHLHGGTEIKQCFTDHLYLEIDHNLLEKVEVRFLETRAQIHSSTPLYVVCQCSVH